MLAAAALLVAACGAGSEGEGDDGADAAADGNTPAAPATLTIGFAAEPANLDFTTTDGAAIPEALLVNVYEGLVKIDQATGEIAPLLAESWDVSDDGRTYTFTLREDVTFSNGEPFTAEDVKFSIERVQSDDWTINLKGAMDVVESVEVVSPTEVNVTLSEPSNDWLFRMTTRIGAMFSPTGVDDLANEAIGTGPYLVAEWNRGESIVLQANEDYWGERPAVETVTLRYFDDPTATNNALLTEGIDVIGTVQAPEALDQFDDDRFQVIEGTTNGEVTLAFNNESGPMSDVRVRQAIKHAIDHEALLETAWAGRGFLIGAPVPPTDPWYEDLTDLYPYDPQQARDLLADAGYEDDLSLRFRIANLPYAVAAAQVVSSQLEEVGVAAEIEPLEFPDRWLEEVFNDADYDMSIISHVEPRDIGAMYGNPDYYFRYDSQEVRDRLAEADAGTVDEQVEATREAARVVAEDAAADWLFLQPNLIVAVSDVAGLPENRVGEAFDLTTISRQ
jgi:peptide/nickel transport system substrate-binding protein